MRTEPFQSAYAYLMDLYDIEMQENEFYPIAMIAWDKIGNKEIELKKIKTSTKNCRITMPCEAAEIEGVFANFPDMVLTSNKETWPMIRSGYIEGYIESWKIDKSAYYDWGKLLDYQQVGNELVFTQDWDDVTIIYRVPKLDSDGYPYLNHKEVEAIAAYCAYIYYWKKGMKTKDQLILQMVPSLKRDWSTKMYLARTPEFINQNQWDELGNVRSSWDRKVYHKSYKPIK